MYKKVWIIILGIIPLISILFSSPLQIWAAELNPNDKLFIMEQAIEIGLKNDAELADARMQVSKKQIQLLEAQRAILNQEEKDFFSLFAKQHSLSKDIELIMKVQLVRNEWKTAKEELKQKERTVRFNIEKLYIQAVQAMMSTANAEKKMIEVKKSLSDTLQKRKFGLKSEDDVKAAEEALAQAESGYKQAQLTYKSSKIELGEKIDFDLEVGYQFGIAEQHAVMSQSLMWRLSASAEKTDVELYKDVVGRKMAEEKVSVTRRLYRNKFSSSQVRAIEAMYTPKTMDYDEFLIRYDQMLNDIKRKWEGFFFIPIPFIIIIPIPKPILQGEYDGLRYFDDAPYALPVFMLEMDKARLKENKTRKTVLLKIKQSYLDTKLVEETYIQSMIARDKAIQVVAEAEKKRRLGLIKADELKEFQDAVTKAEEAVQSNYFSYRMALSKLDYDSGGGLNSQLRGGRLPYKVDDGLSPLKNAPEQENLVVGSWKLKPVAETMTSEFQIKADPKLGATHYSVHLKSGEQVGDKMPLKGKIIHLSILFQDPAELTVKLYKDSEVIAEAELDGLGSDGNLKRLEKGGT